MGAPSMNAFFYSLPWLRRSSLIASCLGSVGWLSYEVTGNHSRVIVSKDLTQVYGNAGRRTTI